MESISLVAAALGLVACKSTISPDAVSLDTVASTAMAPATGHIERVEPQLPKLMVHLFT